MAGKAYRKTEVVGTSTKGFQEAVDTAIAEARKVWKGLAWFEVAEMRGNLAGKEVEYQVTLKVGYRLIEP
jgi:flavin-binding protein dodecin